MSSNWGFLRQPSTRSFSALFLWRKQLPVFNPLPCGRHILICVRFLEFLRFDAMTLESIICCEMFIGRPCLSFFSGHGVTRRRNIALGHLERFSMDVHPQKPAQKPPSEQFLIAMHTCVCPPSGEYKNLYEDRTFQAVSFASPLLFSETAF